MDSKGVMGEEPVGPSMSEGYGDEAFCASLSADAERPACRQIVALYGRLEIQRQRITESSRHGSIP